MPGAAGTRCPRNGSGVQTPTALPPGCTRILAIGIGFLWLLGTGCSVTHPRAAKDLGRLLKRPRRILLLEPDVNVMVKYISTPRTVHVRRLTRDFHGWLANGVAAVLREQNHQVYYAPKVPSLARRKASVRRLRSDLIGLTETIIEHDPAYELETIPPGISTRGRVPPWVASNVDLIVVLSGEVLMETTKEFYVRWFRNVVLNVLLFPVSLVSALVPLAMPISVNISTSIFEGSPEHVSVTMGVIDCRRERFVYENDYYYTTAPRDREDLQDLAEELLEEFGPVD
ncbi:hypothetical protein ACFL59_05920 [Planctomycetota bacterium]